MPLKQDAIAFVGELIGTTMFIFLGLGGISTAIYSETSAQQQTSDLIGLSNQTVMFISLSMGFSLLVNAWVFYRITGGLFNPAVTFALWAIGGVTTFRAAILTVAQIAGGILGAGLVALLIPYPITNTITKLATGMNKPMGLFLEAFLTSMLVFTVLMLAAEKHKATFIAPIGIGLVLFVCQLFGTEWTGCGMNPARAFGPSVIGTSFPGYHWIYWAGPYIGSVIAVAFYTLLKLFDYGSVVLGQDADTENASAPVPVYRRALEKAHFSHAQREAMAASGMPKSKIDQAERHLAEKSVHQNGTTVAPGHQEMTAVRPKKAKRQPSNTASANGSAVAPFSALPEPVMNGSAGRPQAGSRKTSIRPGAGTGGVQGIAAQAHEPHATNGVVTDPLGQDAGGIAATGTHTGAGLSKLAGALA